MESPCSSPENECEEPVRGAHGRREAGGVTQIFVEINEVTDLPRRKQGWQANSAFAEPAAELVCEVISL
jgi:hypothetical protein